MKKKKQNSSKIDGLFFPVMHEIWFAPAWQAMSPGARLLYLALRRCYNYGALNNGRISLSHREAQQELNCCKSKRIYIARWFRELQHFGFIVMTSAGRLGANGYGRAPHWRLTELPCNGEPPTKDFLAWNGTPFVNEKTESRVTKVTHPGSQKSPIRRGKKCGEWVPKVTHA
jgi:hypothetical protein